MAAKRKANSPDSNIFFQDDRKAGILIQHGLNRAIYFNNGESVDTLDFIDDVTAAQFNTWVQNKRKNHETNLKINHHEHQVANINAEQL